MQANMAETAVGGPMRVLIVEDEPTLAAPIRRALEREGYLVSVCDTGRGALKLSRTWQPNVVLLDLLLPDIDGREVAREIRRRSAVPIIMVTALGDENDRVTGLEIGADDYITKPFSLPELIARVRAVTRRATAAPAGDQVLRFKDLRLDLATYRGYKGDEELQLTNKEFEVLRMLLARAGELVRRDELVRAVWNAPLSEGSATLDVHMSWLRKKLGDDPKEPRYIQTVRGVGFRLATD